MIRLEDATARGKLARWTRRTAVAALLCLPLGALPALADSQPSSTYASDRTAYDRAIAVGTTSALHNFLLSYPNSALADKVLELLVQHCTSLKEQGSDSSCDLQALIAPAAGPSNNATPFSDPPSEHSARDNASNS